MTRLKVREATRRVERDVVGEVSLDGLCDDPCARALRVASAEHGVVLYDPQSTLQQRILPGESLSVGAVELSVERPSGHTEPLAAKGLRRLSLAMGNGTVVRLGERTLTIGRGNSCDVRLGDASVSDVHCRVVAAREGFVVVDAGSTNGTRVNGVRVARALLDEGCELSLGRVILRCVRDGAEEGEDEALRDGSPLIGSSAVMAKVRSEIEHCARTPYAVLVRGETGAGKELVASELHRRSPRASGPYVTVNAGALSPELVESELFGHERGAFTGAQSRRRGLFEQANGGTLFLDEIGELPLDQQVKLLRVLETSEVRRVGSEQVHRVNVRVVCATHRDLERAVQEGSFREDLFHRLRVQEITLPPLRERSGDVAQIAAHLMRRISGELGARRALDREAIEHLMRQPWPGNVRDLLGALRRAAARASAERVGVEHLDAALVTARPSVVRAATTVDRSELQGDALLALYESAGCSLSQLSKVTAMSRAALRERLKKARGEGRAA